MPGRPKEREGPMMRSAGRVFLVLVGLLLVGSQPNDAFKSCGNCDPGWYWGGVSDGAYHFDSTVPDYVKEATYWADDGWGVHYPDQGNTNGIRITIDNMSPGVTGSYDAYTNTLTIAQSVLNDCPAPGCNVLESVISHELGHTVGFDNIESGCESSIMSWDRNRSIVVGPGSEDLCWLSNGYDGWEGDGGGCTECEDRIGTPLQIDYDSRPSTWHEALGRSDLVALVRLNGRTYETSSSGMPLTRFDGEIVQVIKGSRLASRGASVPIVRFGGVHEIAGERTVIRESRFASWSAGETVFVFLAWSEQVNAYTLPFGATAAFKLDAGTGRAQSFARSGFAPMHDGKPIGALLAEVRAAR
jgi:hypothetical protein